MAIGPTRKAGVDGKRGSTPSSVISDFVILNDDATSAQAAGDAVAPGLIDETSFFWTLVPDDATRLLLSGWLNSSVTGVTTDPVVKLLGLKNYAGDDDYGSNANGYGWPIRIDSPTDMTAAGITVDFGTYSTDTFLYSMPDSEFGRINPLTNADGYDLLGCRYVGALVTTAGAVTGSGAEMKIIGSFIN
jgi:hypothetical protein